MLYLLCLSSCTDHFKRHFWALGRLRRNRHNIAGLRSVVRYPTVKCSFVWGLTFVCGRPVEIDPTTGEVTPVAESEQGNWSFVHFRTEAARDQCIRNSGNLILQVIPKFDQIAFAILFRNRTNPWHASPLRKYTHSLFYFILLLQVCMYVCVRTCGRAGVLVCSRMWCVCVCVCVVSLFLTINGCRHLFS
jgi:hypothetical protein